MRPGCSTDCAMCGTDDLPRSVQFPKAADHAAEGFGDSAEIMIVISRDKSTNIYYTPEFVSRQGLTVTSGKIYGKSMRILSAVR